MRDLLGRFIGPSAIYWKSVELFCLSLGQIAEQRHICNLYAIIFRCDSIIGNHWQRVQIGPVPHGFINVECGEKEKKKQRTEFQRSYVTLEARSVKGSRKPLSHCARPKRDARTRPTSHLRHCAPRRSAPSLIGSADSGTTFLFVPFCFEALTRTCEVTAALIAANDDDARACACACARGCVGVRHCYPVHRLRLPNVNRLLSLRLHTQDGLPKADECLLVFCMQLHILQI